MSEIFKTSDYSIFRLHPSNREIETNHLNKIKKSILENNLLRFRPILVDENMYIIDGQYRYRAAQDLGLQLFYQINPLCPISDMILLSDNQKKWTIENFIKYQCSEGNQACIKIVDFCNSKNLSLTEFIKMLSTHKSTMTSEIKKGTIRMPKQQDFDKIEAICEKMDTFLKKLSSYMIINKEICQSVTLRKALLIFLNHPKVDFDVLMKKLNYKAEAIRPCTSIMAYYGLLRDIYNWKNVKPIELQSF